MLRRKSLKSWNWKKKVRKRKILGKIIRESL